MKLADNLLYVLSMQLTWVLLRKILFHEYRGWRWADAVRVLLLTAVQMLMQELRLLPPVLLALDYLFTRRVYRESRREVAVKTVFTYATALCSTLACAIISDLVCGMVVRLPSDIMVTVGRCFCLSLMLLLLSRICRRRDMFHLVRRYSVGVLVVTMVLFLAALDVIRLPYEIKNREFYIFALFAVCTMAAVIIVWILREQAGAEKLAGMERELDRAKRELEDAARNRNALMSDNHALEKVIPAIRESYAQMKRRMEQAEWRSGKAHFAEELITKMETAEALHAQVKEGYDSAYYGCIPFSTTGIDLLDSAVIVSAREAYARGVKLECTVTHDISGMLEGEAAISVLELEQLLGNLLDNAVHAAEIGEETDRAVCCTIGYVSGTCCIKVSDTGSYFAPGILERLGAFGNTTDGRGVGYAHILRILAARRASLFIEEFVPPRASGIRKSISVRFDGGAKLEIMSPREDVKSGVRLLRE